jgi:hypothetical protein
MQLPIKLIAGCLLGCMLAGCSSSQPSTEPASHGAVAPMTPDQIDRVSLLAWKETLGPKYPLTIARADSVAMIVSFFDSNSPEWKEQSPITQIPIFAGFYAKGELQTERGFVEFSHDAGGLLLVRERGKLFSRSASAADVARFLSFFGVGAVVLPD